MGISERLDMVEAKVNEQDEKINKKEKKFKLPFGTKVGASQAKKNYVTVFKVNENKTINVSKCQIVDQAIMMDGIPRLGLTKYVMYLKKNPILWLPSWRVVPFCPEQDMDDSLKDGSNVKGWKILLAKMHSELVSVKKKMGYLIWIIIAGLACIVGYAIIKG